MSRSHFSPTAFDFDRYDFVADADRNDQIREATIKLGLAIAQAFPNGIDPRHAR